MSRKSVAIHFTVEEEVVKKIDELCGGPASNLGRIGGRNNFVRGIVYDYLGLALPMDPVLANRETLTAQVRAQAKNMRALERAIQLYDEGESLQNIADALNREGFPSKRGKSWHRFTVRQLLGLS